MIPQFAFRLICGLATAWCLIPRTTITSGFFRIQMLITLGLSVLAALTASQYPARPDSSIPDWLVPAALAVAVLSFLGAMMWTLERRTAGHRYALGILALSSVMVCGMTGQQPFTAATAIEGLSSAWLTGCTTAAMLLGHWYLTATGMSLRPLAEYNAAFAVALILRILVAFGQALSRPELLAGQPALATLRWSGLIGPLILAVLVRQVLTYRNTQAATGILYAGTILVFMGEMAAVLLHQH